MRRGDGGGEIATRRRRLELGRPVHPVIRSFAIPFVPSANFGEHKGCGKQSPRTGTGDEHGIAVNETCNFQKAAEAARQEARRGEGDSNVRDDSMTEPNRASVNKRRFATNEILGRERLSLEDAVSSGL